MAAGPLIPFVDENHLPRTTGTPKEVANQEHPMKTIKTLFVIAIVSLAIASPAAAQEETFNGKEWSLSLFGSWVDKKDSDVAPGAGLSYFFTKNLGVGAFTHWENYGGTFFDNMSAEGYFRWPLDRLKLAPYGLAGIGYSFETEESFGMFGAGAEWRFNPKWGAFGDVRWQVNGDTSDGVGLRLGLRLVF